MKDCVFCDITVDRDTIAENKYALAIFDKYPVTQGHSLVITRRHFDDYFEITKKEREAVHELIVKVQQVLTKQDSTIEGFNIGINIGECAGQTICHCHIHLIPRRTNDVDDPRGGVRHTIPNKGYY